MHAAACAAMGYFIGTVNPAYLFSKIKGFDVRERGSGNAGATNALLTMGKVVGVLCALLDIIKAFLACRIAKLLFPGIQFVCALTGAACILGHIFPVWMNFRGGKGLACLAGVIMAYSFKVFFAILALELVLVLMVDYICVMPMFASVLFTVFYLVVAQDLIGTVALMVVTAVIECKHLENVKRILEGRELHVSYLWNKEKEIERLTSVMGDDRLDELV